jgi:anti-sigma B factor antagonist
MRQKNHPLGQFPSGCPPFDKDGYGQIMKEAVAAKRAAEKELTTMANLLQTELARVEPGITVVHMTGKIVLGPDCQGLEVLVHELLKKDENKVIFDLSGVSYIDSTGMGVIVSCLSRVMKAGGGLRLAGVADRVRHLFKITRLDNIIAFYPTVLAAAESFASPGQGGGPSKW